MQRDSDSASPQTETETGTGTETETEPNPDSNTPPPHASRVLSNDGAWTITWWTEPATIPMHELHQVEVRVVSARDAEAPLPSDLSLAVDARMPHHRHGMLVAPEVTRLGPGRFRVDGMMLHMSGYWEYYFDVGAGGVIERAQDSIELE
ncbi:MAG: hypothetical protein AB8G96_14945 [Phycisphaerales bacterium]